jgi:uroporphyrinogen-III synthase
MVQDSFTLKGKTVAITRPFDQIEETGNLIKLYNGQPYFVPLIEIKPTCDLQAVTDFFSKLQNCQIDYVVFMSVNGIRFLFSFAEDLGLSSELKVGLNNVVVIAVGPKTAQELTNCGIIVGLVPKDYSSNGILQCLTEQGVSGKSVWIPRTSGASPTLADSLRELGTNVHELYVYESLLPRYTGLYKQFLEDLKSGKIDAIIFGSSLSAKNLFKIFVDFVSKQDLCDLMNRALTIVAIGPITAKTLRELGLRVDVMPKKYLFEEALKELSQHWI